MTSSPSEPASNTDDSHETITITRENQHHIIRDEETGVTTQAETKIEALLMLADALSGHPDHETDPLPTALDVFVQDASMKQLQEDLFNNTVEYTNIDENREHHQKQAALYLATHHKTRDFSNPTQLNVLLKLLRNTNPDPRHNLTGFIG